MEEVIYTLGVWRVKPGAEGAFIAAWKALANIFAQLPEPPSGKGTLIQSLADPLLLYSFGPWKSLNDVEAMRNNPTALAGLNKLRDLCTEAAPGSFRIVAEA